MNVTKDLCFIVKLTKDCNLRCSYCYHFNNMKTSDSNLNVMTSDTLEQTIKSLLSNNSFNAHFIWHGGEPLMMGLDYFKSIIQMQMKYNIKDLTVSNSVQTNGTLITEDWIDYFKENDFHVGVSIDGYMELHKNNRNLKSEAIFTDLMKNVKLLANKNVRFGVLSVINRNSLHNEEKIFDFFIENSIYNIGLLPSIVTVNNKVVDDLSINPDEYMQFLINYFNVWRMKGINGISIREFDEYFRGRLNIKHRLCTNSNDCQQYFTVLPEGSIYLCDCFPSNSITEVGNVYEPLNKIKKNPIMKSFMSNIAQIPDDCKKCVYRNICNGGCKFYRYISDPSFIKPSYYCKSYKGLYDHINKVLKEENIV